MIFLKTKKKNNMIIAIDFDGTIVEHAYPKIGKPIPGAIHWIKEIQSAGGKIILLTMRSDDGNEYGKALLQEAVDYLKKHGIELYGVNNNKNQHRWTNSKKVYANIYIDDAAFGCPLIYSENERPMADWSKIGPGVIDIMRNK